MLNKIVNKLKDERDLSRKGRKTKIILDDTSFTKIRIREICKILLQLQDDEGALKILDVLQPIETVQLNKGSTVIIPILLQRIRFRELMLMDDVGQRDEFCGSR